MCRIEKKYIFAQDLTRMHKVMDKAAIYQSLVKYSLVGKVARNTGLHRNTIKNILTGQTAESAYTDLVVAASEVEIMKKEEKLQTQITGILSQLAA